MVEDRETKESLQDLDIQQSEGKEGDGQNTITLSTGVVLRIKSTPPNLIGDIAAAMPRPKPPVQWLESKGISEENPLDPDYLERVKMWEAEVVSKINDAFVLRGTELIECPKGVPGPDDPEFLAEMALLGRVLEREGDSEPLRRRRRYLAWIKYVAAASREDVANLVASIGRLSGVSEADVASAVGSFRSDEGRGANRKPDAGQGDQRRDRVR